MLAAFGTNKKLFTGKRVSDKMTEVMNSRRCYLANKAEGGDVFPVDAESGAEITAEIVVPIVSNGDCLGAVVLLSFEEGALMDPAAVKLARLTADIIANQFE